MKHGLLVLVLTLVAAPACRTVWYEHRTLLAHDVYFTLREPSGASAGALVQACERLADLPGVESLTVGHRGEEFARPVNDLDFDVALRVVFEDRAAHDAYQESTEHRALLAEFEGALESVRVFDSWVVEH